MARHESDREDILREATALVERVELTIAHGEEHVVAGFRRDGAASFFFGADPVYQFNAAGELRRAYADGLLLKAERGRLVALRRERSEGETALVRHELSDEETATFCRQIQARLERLLAGLQTGAARIVGQVPAEGDVATRVLKCLEGRPPVPVIAGRPNAGG